ncbi:hypothetical protein N9901_03615 [Flavobacteriaceae bacterium]|nr:hypothetical protein [Flavobacteriaceae bacterium]
MNKYIITLALISLFNISVFSQKKRVLSQKELKKIEKLSKKGNFEQGFIIIKQDTIQTNILINSKKKYNLMYCITKDSNGIQKTYLPENIRGYYTKTDIYARHKTDQRYHFIKKIETGKIDLFEKSYIPLSPELKFYLKFKNSYNLYSLTPYDNSIEEYNAPTRNNPDRKILISNNSDEKFIQFINMIVILLKTLLNRGFMI